ncbi:hypothetical protein [Acinetobacter radioresistens]|uniref:hypothetical protein n=1 Tax=Acinetobacter radioresistens TaxID=40216 RepID=UPI000DAE7CDC|nr:hypothetical protein [Acinetobacter radioresistens]AWV87082.1 hypothetical protein DOM24_10960 [Acinetobacter radioresistens]MCX0328958.1 hypothetical protein [Acinetobacter radioresistens]
MNVADLRKFYNVENNSQLSKKIKRGRSTITGWEEEGIPLGTQAIFELLTGGKLKADRQALASW